MLSGVGWFESCGGLVFFVGVCCLGIYFMLVFVFFMVKCSVLCCLLRWA